MVFLETANAFISSATGNAALAGGILAAIAAFMIVFVIVMIGLYVYLSFAYMAIARKAKYSNPALAWIPIIGPLIVTSGIAEMHWWPILLLVGTIIPYIGFLFSIALAVFAIIWLWKTFEAVDRPGWWAIVSFIPVVNLILLGVAAWSKK